MTALTSSRSIWELIWTCFRSTTGFLTGVVALALGFILWLAKPTTTVPLPCVIFTAVLVVWIIAALFESVRVAFRGIRAPLPEVKISYEEPRPGGGTDFVLLMEPSELFSHGIGVSIFSLSAEGYERFIGFGQVLNIQDNGKIQVRVGSLFPGLDELEAKIRGRETLTLKSLRVKPSMPIAPGRRMEELSHE